MASAPHWRSPISHNTLAENPIPLVVMLNGDGVWKPRATQAYIYLAQGIISRPDRWLGTINKQAAHRSSGKGWPRRARNPRERSESAPTVKDLAAFSWDGGAQPRVPAALAEFCSRAQDNEDVRPDERLPHVRETENPGARGVIPGGEARPSSPTHQ
jgi:hypothetical protein